MTNTFTEPALGDHMPDGTVYAGISPDTGKKMYAMPADAPLRLTFDQIATYVATLNAHRYLGHDDWRVSSQGELNVLFNNRAKIGGFDTSWYWCSSPYGDNAWGQRFNDGSQFFAARKFHSSVRVVR